MRRARQQTDDADVYKPHHAHHDSLLRILPANQQAVAAGKPVVDVHDQFKTKLADMDALPAQLRRKLDGGK